jgi:hypothetical protein
LGSQPLARYAGPARGAAGEVCLASQDFAFVGGSAGAPTRPGVRPSRPKTAVCLSPTNSRLATLRLGMCQCLFGNGGGLKMVTDDFQGEDIVARLLRRQGDYQCLTRLRPVQLALMPKQ